MSIAKQVQVIMEGLFDPYVPPDATTELLSVGIHRVDNWARMRPALLALREMPWCTVDQQWEYFLDEARYPVGAPLELRGDELETFVGLTQELLDHTRDGMEVLSSVHRPVGLECVIVTLQTRDLRMLRDGLDHVRKITTLAAIDDAIEIHAVEPGSLEIFLTAGKLSLLGLQLAITLARQFGNARVHEQVALLRRLWNMRQTQDTPTDEDLLDVVRDDIQQRFWSSADELLKVASEAAGKNNNEARNGVNAAAKEIHEKASDVSAHWQLPPATIRGLPSGVTIDMNSDDPAFIAQVVRALAQPLNTEESP